MSSVYKMKLKYKNKEVLCLFLLGICLGLIDLAFLSNRVLHVIFVMYITLILCFSVIRCNKGWIRPFSLLILSFIVFVWSRYVLDLFTNIEIITTGNRITESNTNLVAIYLGIAISIICISSIICENSIENSESAIEKILNFENRATLPNWCCKILLLCGLLCFAYFILDSYRKIAIIQSNDYFFVNEGVMLQGYTYFTIGKYFVILWITFSKNKKRFIIGSTILALASTGYLMRGARGYAVMYFLTWILFLSHYVKIRISHVACIGIGIIFMANAILSYRLGRTVSTGFINIVFSVLNSQGASLEQVFGSVLFREEIAKELNPINLFVNIDGVSGYGSVVDKVRGTGFVSGGFGSSFFGEAFFLGLIPCILFMIIAGIMCGVLERAYVISNGKQENLKSYASLMLFMTTPNLIYLGRSNVKDFIFKTLITLFLVFILQKFAPKARC